MSLAPTELLMGVVVCGITAWFSSGFFVQNEETAFKLLNPVRLAMLAFYFLVIFLWELIKANCAMAVAVLTNRPFQQALIKVPVRGITNYYALAVLADCITLTPGTITFDLVQEDGEISIYVQWFGQNLELEDRKKAGDIIKGRMEDWIRRIWA